MQPGLRGATPTARATLKLRLVPTHAVLNVDSVALDDRDLAEDAELLLELCGDQIHDVGEKRAARANPHPNRPGRTLACGLLEAIRVANHRGRVPTLAEEALAIHCAGFCTSHPVSRSPWALKPEHTQRMRQNATSPNSATHRHANVKWVRR